MKTNSVTSTAVPGRGARERSARVTRLGLLFSLPWLIGFTVFCAYPVLASLYYSLCSYDGIRAPRFIGLQNFQRLFFEDDLFWKSLTNTFYMVILGLPVGLIAALAIALLLHQRLRGIALYRTIFYLPSITPVVATSILWQWLLNPEIGLINVALSKIGIAGPSWLTDPLWAKPALILMGLWGAGGGMVIYLAALQDIPESLYEAASLDGAGSITQFFRITLPMLTPVILFNLIMGLIGTFQYFTQAYVMTNGGPEDSTTFYALHLFNKAFLDFQMGYASAMAWVLFIITLICALFVFKTSARWVYYSGEEK